MPGLTERDRKTLRMASIGVAVYLVLFFGWRGWKSLGRERADYHKVIARVRTAENDLLPLYENKVLLFEKLRDTYRLDPRKLSKESLAANASAAIQTAAREGGFKLGPIRENAGGASGRELSSIQFEGMGPVTNALGLLHRVQSLGYPVLIDALQLTPQPQPPGIVKMNVTIVILNFEQWKKGEAPNA